MAFIDVDEFFMFRCVECRVPRCVQGWSTSEISEAPRNAAALSTGACVLPASAVALLRRDPWPSIQSLPNLLRKFEGPGAPPNAYSGLGVHWLIFGSSGHEHRPPGGTLRSYTRCLQLRHGQHAVVKTIVRTA